MLLSNNITTPWKLTCHKILLLGVVCVTCFFVGLIFCTGAGEYWLKLFDSFAGTIGLVLVALLETLAVMYVYGHKK
jgi:solute carrier family 6 amino acid/orphan transporter-like 15/16/17/18/20